jgi:hypothetical protein
MEAGTQAGLSRRGPELAEQDPAPALGPACGPWSPPPLLGEGAGAPKRSGPDWEEAEEVEREAGRADPAQELGGATHLGSRPGEPEWLGSLAAPRRRSAHAPTPPPSSPLVLQLQQLRRRRAQPGNHDGRAARAHSLPPFSPPPPACPPSNDGGRTGRKNSRTRV